MTQDDESDLCKGQGCQWRSAAVNFSILQAAVMCIEAFV
jgi:hypothetical protein